MKSFLRIAMAVCLAGPAIAQEAKAPVLETKTIELRHLQPQEAVNLLRPYLVSPVGSVSLVSPTIPVITVKDFGDNVTKMEKVLAKYDHSPATIRLVFQLIEADTGNKMTSTSGGVANDLSATLRSVLRFSSYRLLAQGVGTAGENQSVTQQLGNADENSSYHLYTTVGAIRLSEATLLSQASVRTISSAEPVVDTTATGSVHLRVELVRRYGVNVAARGTEAPSEGVLTTGLDVPLGHTVVLGTAATKASGVALILTVKPELVRIK